MTTLLWWLVGAAIFGLAALLAVGLAQAAAQGDRNMRRDDIDDWDEL